MRISHGSRHEKWNNQNGYGYATDNVLSSLRSLGYKVSQNDETADVQMWFDQPHHWKWNNSSQYRIGYHPWESTKLYPGWKSAMNKCDEIWTPSALTAKWYKEAGIRRPIYVYPHGVDHNVWVPTERVVEDKMRFFHVGGEALRKGLDTVIPAFRAAFPNNEDVELVLKQNQEGWNIPSYGKIKILTNLMPLEELVALYHNCHVFVYPSWGEGFGLNPLQAIATGMPTICTTAWAPYKELIQLPVSSALVDSPWPKVHPGKMFQPDFDDVVDHMRYAYSNYDFLSEDAMNLANYAHAKYDWKNFTKEAFGNLEYRLKTSQSS